MRGGGSRGVVARRVVGGRSPLPTFLIVCEGTKTEPQYFRSFRLPSVEVIGTGKNTSSLVDEAIRLKESREVRDHYWCVFDRDSFPARSFNAALQKARSAGFEVAYSNEAFKFAKMLLASYSGHNPEKDNPSTTVHLLVEKLRALL